MTYLNNRTVFVNKNRGDQGAIESLLGNKRLLENFLYKRLLELKEKVYLCAPENHKDL